MKGFQNPFDPDGSKTRAAVRLWTIEKLKLDDAATVEIIEHQCADANCLVSETVISVENTVDEGNPDTIGKGSRFFKISKPLVYVRKIDVATMREMPSANAAHRH